MPKMHPSIFEYLRPSPDQITCMNLMREAYAKMMDMVAVSVPDGRYKALAITSLEESAMWANKGVTRESDGTPREVAQRQDEDAEAGQQAQPAQGAEPYPLQAGEKIEGLDPNWRR
jgi:hypothetical protein